MCWGLRPVTAGLARGLRPLWFQLPAAQRGRCEEAMATPAVLSQSWSPAPDPGDHRLGALPDAVLESTRDDTRDGLWPVKCCAREQAATPAWVHGYRDHQLAEGKADVFGPVSLGREEGAGGERQALGGGGASRGPVLPSSRGPHGCTRPSPALLSAGTVSCLASNLCSSFSPSLGWSCPHFA